MTKGCIKSIHVCEALTVITGFPSWEIKTLSIYLYTTVRSDQTI